jgi:carboxypeptidase Q
MKIAEESSLRPVASDRPLRAASAPRAREIGLNEYLRSRYAKVAALLLGSSIVEGGAVRYARQLSDQIGSRLAGSPGERAAISWAVTEIRRLGLEPREEPVMVPVWVRGEETARLLTPASQRVIVAALGGSEPTPAMGVRANVVEVESFESLRALGEEGVRGRIVLFNKQMEPGLEGYSAVVDLRTQGASESARLGAVGSLVRSIGTTNGRLPHTGSVRYADGVPRIPSAAISAEDADLIHRLLAHDDRVDLMLRLGCETRPDVPGANVVAELPGRERPEEIVLIGAHLDSWDLGTGAIDDAAGVGMVLNTLRMFRAHGLVPRRSVRAVLYANEENGLTGARAYAEAHTAEMDRHAVAIEADTGAGRPLGLAVHAGPGASDRIEALCRFLLPGTPRILEQVGGSDIEPLGEHGVPLLGLLQNEDHYFDWHHTAADTFDKIEPYALAETAAFFATVAYVQAEDEGLLPRPAPTNPRS